MSAQSESLSKTQSPKNNLLLQKIINYDKFKKINDELDNASNPENSILFFMNNFDRARKRDEFLDKYSTYLPNIRQRTTNP